MSGQRGFTLIEVLVITPILVVTIAIITRALFVQYGNVTQVGSQLNLQVNAQTIAFSMQDDVLFANAFVSTKNSNLNDTYQPGGGWTYNTTPQTLIISSPAITTNYRDPNRAPVYINTEGCDAANIEKNDVLLNNTIYFVAGTNLYKRILSAPATMSLCGVSYVKQSCPAPNASASCPEDKLLSDKLNSFAVTYYSDIDAVVTTPELATKIKVELQLKDKAFAEDIYASSSLTLKRINQ